MKKRILKALLKAGDTKTVVNTLLEEVDSLSQRKPEVVVGPKGEKGERGEKGEPGERGEQGIQGEKGEKGDTSDVTEELDDIRRELFRNIPRGGGQANRQINLNSSVMSSKYTDINFKDDNGIVWEKEDDDTNKRVNITASVISNGGDIAFASVITANTTGDSTGGQNYIYFANAGITFTLPTAVSNRNSYTVKCVAASSVLLATTSSQTIDGNASESLHLNQYESLTMHSDDSNWYII